ncbi:MAG: hypothetical protein JW966_10380 [Anaerolineae bacterium]|nr:hypothetical protein [Anaerolineae bacterium]
MTSAPPSQVPSTPPSAASAPPARITVYGHSRCPMVPPVRGMLKQSKVKFDYVDIHKDPAARDRVRTISGGSESVPTLVFPDGSTLVEPSTGELKDKLVEAGYVIPLSARLLGHFWKIVLLVSVVAALLNIIGIV